MWSIQGDAGLAFADEIIAPHYRVHDPGTPDAREDPRAKNKQ
jgi:hypothetical protein